MKNKILSAVLLSSITLSTFSGVVTVSADDFDSKIATQESLISSLSTEQASAQAEVSSIQAQVSALQEEQATLETENARLELESEALFAEIETLSAKIVSRSESIKKQARSAQKNNTATSYISTIINSESISDAISRVVAIREIVAASEKMLEQQEADKLSIEEKQKLNQEAINTVEANLATIAENSYALTTKKAELEVAQLNLASQLATAQTERDSLLSQKAEAEAAAKAAAAAEAAAKAAAAAQAKAQAESVAAAQAQAAQQAAAVQEAVTTQVTTTQATTAQTAAVATPVATTVAPVTTQAAAVTAPQASTSVPVNTYGNTYPVGQCTWGVKSLASWVGNYWGNANQWIASAQAAGHSVGKTPVVGAVAVWPTGAYGHVAYVTAVESETNIQVMESNYAGNQYIGNFRGWFNPVADSGGTIYYIYP